jgi:hypothetical protein
LGRIYSFLASVEGQAVVAFVGYFLVIDFALRAEERSFRFLFAEAIGVVHAFIGIGLGEASIVEVACSQILEMGDRI